MFAAGAAGMTSPRSLQPATRIAAIGLPFNFRPERKSLLVQES